MTSTCRPSTTAALYAPLSSKTCRHLENIMLIPIWFNRPSPRNSLEQLLSSRFLIICFKDRNFSLRLFVLFFNFESISIISFVQLVFGLSSNLRPSVHILKVRWVISGASGVIGLAFSTKKAVVEMWSSSSRREFTCIRHRRSMSSIHSSAHTVCFVMIVLIGLLYGVALFILLFYFILQLQNTS